MTQNGQQISQKMPKLVFFIFRGKEIVLIGHSTTSGILFLKVCVIEDTRNTFNSGHNSDNPENLVSPTRITDCRLLNFVFHKDGKSWFWSSYKVSPIKLLVSSRVQILYFDSFTASQTH